MSAPSRSWLIEICPVHGGVVSAERPCREVVERKNGRTTYCHKAEEVEVIPVTDAQKVEAERNECWKTIDRLTEQRRKAEGFKERLLGNEALHAVYAAGPYGDFDRFTHNGGSVSTDSDRD